MNETSKSSDLQASDQPAIPSVTVAACPGGTEAPQDRNGSLTGHEPNGLAGIQAYGARTGAAVKPTNPRDSPTREQKKTRGSPNPRRKNTAVSFVAPCGNLLETTFDPGRQPSLQFAVWSRDGGKICMADTSGNNEMTLVPPADANGLISTGVVLLPSHPTDYGSQDELIAEICAFIHRYADIPDLWEELIAHYVLMTWVYDKFTAVPYLRFQGEPGTGKTRLLQIAGHLSYKAIVGGGSTTASPLFRLLDVYHGTFVIDEADYTSVVTPKPAIEGHFKTGHGAAART